MIITIDGPTASGKSTTAALLAKKLHIMYLSSGWLYRTVAYILTRDFGYTPDMLQNPKVKDIDYCLDMQHLVYQYDEARGGVLLFNDVDITYALKDCTVDTLVALISPIPAVRNCVTLAQKERAACAPSCIVEGRDVGSVVFPHADYKFYLTASLEVRAQRWQNDQAHRGNNFTLDQACQAVHSRDKKDFERAHSPLVIPQGATIIDNSNLTLNQVVDQILTIVKK